ncbi:nuclear transport factor 2 family protein [Shewanella marinintestina]|uniref:nuclear transport factor 2 family protein n=1 Tax=Shewanella marinintestina TaxID=190305 RepID=UPI00201037E9|nr:nuclear transport factor 2 family protein [Shewanella marinintestina]MCL1147392.1 nuclear transport factor 2 family protein [Shewanella marinintestina]
MKPYIWLLALSASFSSFLVQANTSQFQTITDQDPEAVKVVKQFIEGFNAQSVEQLIQHTTENVHWFNLSGLKMDIETSTQHELAAAMSDYFASLNDAKARLRQIVVSANYVSTVEEVTWSHDGEQSSQCSLGVYQLKGNKISAVWYYPAHTCDQVTSPQYVEPEIGLLKETRQ